jgi:hypothetical protein
MFRAGILWYNIKAGTEKERAMDERSVLKATEGLGYQLLRQTHRHSPGGSGLLVAIRKEPTGKHFDPETLHVHLRDRLGMATWRSLSLLSPGPDSDRVCPGRVILSDRSDKRVEFFTFGGSLEVIAAPDAQVYALYPPAPVLELVAEEETVADQLAAETESLLGQVEVQWGHDEHGFNRRLAEIEPLQFYMGTLHSLLEQYEHSYPLEETYHELCTVLHQERAWLVGQRLWPDKPYLLEDLLSPQRDPVLLA